MQPLFLAGAGMQAAEICRKNGGWRQRVKSKNGRCPSFPAARQFLSCYAAVGGGRTQCASQKPMTPGWASQPTRSKAPGQAWPPPLRGEADLAVCLAGRGGPDLGISGWGEFVVRNRTEPGRTLPQSWPERAWEPRLTSRPSRSFASPQSPRPTGAGRIISGRMINPKAARIEQEGTEKTEKTQK